MYILLTLGKVLIKWDYIKNVGKQQLPKVSLKSVLK